MKIVDNYTINEFASFGDQNKRLAVNLKHWLDDKKKITLNYVSFAFDKSGQLYTRDSLRANRWYPTNRVIYKFDGSEL